LGKIEENCDHNIDPWTSILPNLTNIMQLSNNKKQGFFLRNTIFAVYRAKCKKSPRFNQGSKIVSPGGVAQWTPHPPQEQEDPGSNPDRV
jgi:hypothetical protein